MPFFPSLCRPRPHNECANGVGKASLVNLGTQDSGIKSSRSGGGPLESGTVLIKEKKHSLPKSGAIRAVLAFLEREAEQKLCLENRKRPAKLVSDKGASVKEVLLGSFLKFIGIAMKDQISILAILGAVFFTWPLVSSLANEIGATGGQTELKSPNLGRIRLQIPSGVFSSKTDVQLSVTQSKKTAEDFYSTLLTRPGRLRRVSGEIRIRAGKSKPKTNVKLQIQLPASQVSPSEKLKVLAQFFYESDTEIHDSFDEIDSNIDLATRTLKFELGPAYFTSARGRDGKMEAVVVIVADSEK